MMTMTKRCRMRPDGKRLTDCAVSSELFPELEPPVDNPGQRASFIIKPANLRDAARATKLSSRNIDKKSALAAVEILGNRIRITVKYRSVTCRAVAPFLPGSTASPDGTLIFGFPHYQLESLGSLFSEPLSCKIDLKADLWRITYRTGRLPLTTYPTPDHGIASWWPQKQRHVTKFDPRVLRSGLAQGLLVARRNRDQPMYGVVQIEGGQGRAGNPTELVIFAAPGLKNLALRMKAEDLKIINAILFRMNPIETNLIETETHQIIRDRVIECIIEKPEHVFPSVDTLLSAIPADRFFVRTYDLASRINLLSVLWISQMQNGFAILERGGELGNNLSIKVPSSRGGSRPNLH